MAQSLSLVSAFDFIPTTTECPLSGADFELLNTFTLVYHHDDGGRTHQQEGTRLQHHGEELLRLAADLDMLYSIDTLQDHRQMSTYWTATSTYPRKTTHEVAFVPRHA